MCFKPGRAELTYHKGSICNEKAKSKILAACSSQRRGWPASHVLHHSLGDSVLGTLSDFVLCNRKEDIKFETFLSILIFKYYHINI